MGGNVERGMTGLHEMVGAGDRVDDRAGRGGIEAAAPAGHEPVEIRWRHPQGLYQLSFVNALLKLVTLGLYAPWAKTEVRRRLWPAVVINGQPLEYTGEGWHLFRGLVIVGGILVVFTTLYYAVGLYLLLPDPGAATKRDLKAAQGVLSLGLLPFFTFLWGVAQHRAMRYRLRHTVWRGIRGTMGGSALGYGWATLWTHVPVFLTLGLLQPWRTIRLRNRLFSDMRFGSGRFVCRARWLPLMPFWLMVWGAVVWLLLVAVAYGYLASVAANPYDMHDPTLLAWAGWLVNLPDWVHWSVAAGGVTGFLLYEAKKLNEIARGTRYETVRFSMDMTVPSIISVLVRNYLLLLVSFGMFKPVMVANIAAHLVEHLKAHGLLDTVAIGQSPDVPGAAGEGLASYLDIDGI